MKTAPTHPQAAIRRLKRTYLYGLAGLAALALAAFALALVEMADQAAFEREAVQLSQTQDIGTARQALAAAAEEQGTRRNRYRLLQGGIFLLTLTLLAVGTWHVVPTRVRQVDTIVRRLEEAEERWRNIYAAINDGLIIIRPDGTIVAMNPSAEALSGHRSDAMAGRSLGLLLPEPDRSHFPELLPELLGSHGGGQELLLLHRDGRVVHTEVATSPFACEGDARFLVLIHDISVRRALEEHQNEALFFDLLQDLREKEQTAEDLRRRASTDPLTGAYNRAAFDERLAAELARAERHRTPFSLIILDIDHFKQINDTYGHATGDHVLTALVSVATENLRADDVFARWGGEEFVILAPHTDRDGGVRLAEKIRTAVEQHPFDQAGRITVSLGVADYRPREPADQLLSRADAALYQAKRGGRNRAIAA